MSCMLRICGEFLDVDALQSRHPQALDDAWRKGEPRIVPGKFHSTSGAQVGVSDADVDDFKLQLSDATVFLELHASELAQVASFPGVQAITLDFGVSIKEGCATQFSYMPPRFIQLAALAGIGIEISHYPCSDDEDEIV